MRRVIRSFVACVGMLVLSGCGEEPPPESGSLDAGVAVPALSPACPTCLGDAGLGNIVADSAVAVACSALDPGACAQHASCMPIYGLAYDPARYCRGEVELPVYCLARGTQCGFGAVRVVDQAGQRWVLANKCVPPGYSPAPTEVHPITWIEDYTVCPSASLQTRCGQLDEESCALYPACFVQKGRPLDEFGRCKEAGERFVACVQNTTCNRGVYFARDPSGGTWELTGSCLPSGYSALSESATTARAGWPVCAF